MAVAAILVVVVSVGNAGLGYFNALAKTNRISCCAESAVGIADRFISNQ